MHETINRIKWSDNDLHHRRRVEKLVLPDHLPDVIIREDIYISAANTYPGEHWNWNAPQEFYRRQTQIEGTITKSSLEVRPSEKPFSLYAIEDGYHQMQIAVQVVKPHTRMLGKPFMTQSYQLLSELLSPLDASLRKEMKGDEHEICYPIVLNYSPIVSTNAFIHYRLVSAIMDFRLPENQVAHLIWSPYTNNYQIDVKTNAKILQDEGEKLEYSGLYSISLPHFDSICIENALSGEDKPPTDGNAAKFSVATHTMNLTGLHEQTIQEASQQFNLSMQFSYPYEFTTARGIFTNDRHDWLSLPWNYFDLRAQAVGIK